jgi:hypothetical protein
MSLLAATTGDPRNSAISKATAGEVVRMLALSPPGPEPVVAEPGTTSLALALAADLIDASLGRPIRIVVGDAA